MSPSKNTSKNMALDPREPLPAVTTNIESHLSESLNPDTAIPRTTTSGNSVEDNDSTSSSSLYPDRLLANASSSGSLTDKPARHGRPNSTTITEEGVTKWMQKGSYGQKTPDDIEQGVETHVVCMLKEDVDAGLAATENEVGHDATAAETADKLEMHTKSDGVQQGLVENAVDQHLATHARGNARAEAAELTVVGMSVDRETHRPVAGSSLGGKRCSHCGGQVVAAKTGEAAVCQGCGKLQRRDGYALTIVLG